MLVRNVLRTGASASRLTAARFGRLSRSISASAQGSAKVVQSTPTPAKPREVKPKKMVSAKKGGKVVAAQAAPVTVGRKKTSRPMTPTVKAQLLITWSWLDETKKAELRDALATREFPEWMPETYNLARQFRSARARLWVPTADEVAAFTGEPTTNVQNWLDEQLEQSSNIEPEQQLDAALRPVWENMSDEARKAALVRVRFECIRKLGWRQGYSSGYPRPQEGDESHLPQHFGTKTKQGLAVFRDFHDKEAALAWDAWLALTPMQRTAEHKAAWVSRDRSLLYLDDTDHSKILGATAPRWYAVPERAGELSFLPNTIVRFVKNFTREGQEYDPWKASFRVPLNMHKHGLRTYLLQIYGLKTTWARSMVYRSPNSRDPRTYKKITGRGRTYKKVEVGLLEPFLFPEISPDFMKRELFASELEYEARRMYLRMTKGRRWRGKKTVDQYEKELANRHKSQYHSLDPLSSPGVHESETEEFKKFPRLIARANGIPTAKHGKILELLNTQRREKDARINALIEVYRQEAQDSRKTST